MSITVTLDPTLEARLRARVEAGEFQSLDAAVEEAVREFVLLEPPLGELRARIKAGIGELAELWSYIAVERRESSRSQ